LARLLLDAAEEKTRLLQPVLRFGVGETRQVRDFRDLLTLANREEHLRAALRLLTARNRLPYHLARVLCGTLPTLHPYLEPGLHETLACRLLGHAPDGRDPNHLRGRRSLLGVLGGLRRPAVG